MADDDAIDTYDVLIAGGGLVGASLAIALDGAGLSVALAEAVPPRADLQPSYDERNLALAGASVNALRALGVLDASAPVQPIARIHVSRRGDFGSVAFDAAKLGLADIRRDDSRARARQCIAAKARCDVAILHVSRRRKSLRSKLAMRRWTSRCARPMASVACARASSSAPTARNRSCAARSASMSSATTMASPHS